MVSDRFAVILPAAGRSRRYNASGGTDNKVFADLDGRPVWLVTALRFVNRADVGQMIVAVAAEDREEFVRRFAHNLAVMDITLVDGGAERCDTVRRALEHVRPEIGWVAVHDAARPCVPDADIDAVFAAAKTSGAAILARPIPETVKRVDENGTIHSTVPRDRLFAAQTPQVFRADRLRAAHQAWASKSGPFAGADAPPLVTDDAQLLECLGEPCRVVTGSPWNLKITTHDDLNLAEVFLKVMSEAKAAEAPRHPFADEITGKTPWSDLPKPKINDLFLS